MNIYKNTKTISEYLSQLEASLQQHFCQTDINDILADYRGFFEAGLQDGMSEQMIIDEFGTPNDVVEKLQSFRSSDNVSNQMPEKSLIIAGRIVLITATIVLLFLLRAMPIFTYLVEDFAISFLIPIFILLSCGMLYGIYVLFRKPVFKAHNSKKVTTNKVILCLSFILPIIGTLIVYGVLIYCIYICSPSMVHTLSPYSASYITTTMEYTINISILITSILTILIAIRSNKFSILKSGLQFAVLIPLLVTYRLLMDLDLDEFFSYLLFEQVKAVWSTSICTILLIIAIHLCIKLISNNRKNIPTTLFALSIAVMAIILSLLSTIIFNNDNYTIELCLIGIFIALGIFLSFHTKLYQNFFIAGKNTSKYALIGIVTSSICGLILSAIVYGVSKSYLSEYSSGMDQHIISSIFFIFLALSNMLLIVFFVSALLYILNGKSNKSHRYLSLIAFAPLIIMNNIITLHCIFDVNSSNWYTFLLYDTKQMFQKSIIMCAVIIIVPIIVFAVSKVVTSLKIEGCKK